MSLSDKLEMNGCLFFTALASIFVLSPLRGAGVPVEECDVCVVGGGAAGIAAALQSGRAGAKTVLVEQGFQVGGNMTTGGVGWPGLFHAWGRQIIDGCAYELITNTVVSAGGQLPDFTKPVGIKHWHHQIKINMPLYVLIAEEALTLAGVAIKYHASPVSIKDESGRWVLDIAAVGELRRLRAKVVIDCTGNGAAAAMAGGARLRDKESAPGSFRYVLNPNTDIKKLDIAKIEKAFRAAVKEGRLKRTDKRGSMSGYLKSGGDVYNYIVPADNSTAEGRTRTNMRGRESLLRMYRFLREQPGLENLELVSMSAEVGVRETYRVEGDYVMTHSDYVSGRDFDDALAYAFYPIDLHDKKKGIKPKHLEEGRVAKVPMRSLMVKGLRDFLVAGRCMSSDRLANSALRVEATCMATGQAAGAAAALAAKSSRSVRNVPAAEIRAALAASGAIVPDVAAAEKQ